MSHAKSNGFSTETKLTQLGRDPSKQTGFVNGPIYRGSTVVYPTLDDINHRRAEFTYGTAGTPTIRDLETAWTNLTGGAGTVLSPSGLGSIALALLTTLKAGDHLLMPDSVYSPSRNFCEQFLTKMNVQTTYYDPLIGENIRELIQDNTTVLFLESPGSQTFEIQDIPLLTKIAKEYNIATIIDNTWATPLFFDAHKHGCELSIEAGTKYLGGHSDLLLGMISANEKWWQPLRTTYDLFAMLPGAEDCFLALRGLRTLHIRLKEAEQRALEMAKWLQTQPEVSRVLHPALPDCPGHEIWQRDFTGSSGLFSIILKPEIQKEKLANMLDHMQIFSMGYSWGGFESLIIPFDCRTYRTATSWNPEGLALRLQIGLEAIEDLKTDLRTGFDRLHQ
mgnify:FL=1